MNYQVTTVDYHWIHEEKREDKQIETFVVRGVDNISNYKSLTVFSDKHYKAIVIIPSDRIRKIERIED